jgi:hypothetical protein
MGDGQTESECEWAPEDSGISLSMGSSLYILKLFGFDRTDPTRLASVILGLTCHLDWELPTSSIPVLA